MQDERTEFYSLRQAAAYAHVCRQAIFVAIKHGQLKAEKRKIRGIEQWIVKRVDLDVYRASKYNREKRVVDGEKLFDIEHDRWSVLHASKTLSSMLGRSFPAHHIYYLLRSGQIRGMKKGNSWVISRHTLVELYHKENGTIKEQMEMV